MRHRTPRQWQAGFTIVELLLYVTLSSALMVSVYQMVQTQQKSYTSQNFLTEIQQNLRVGMYVLTKDIRATGYNPTGKAKVGFVTSFATPNDKFVIDYSQQRLTDTADCSLTKPLCAGVALLADTDGSGTVDANSTEQIAYRHNATNRTLERFVSLNGLPGGSWEAVIDNVEALNLVYLQNDGTIATVAKDIRTIEVALLVRSRKVDPTFVNTETYKNKRGQVLCTACVGDHYQRRLLTTTVQARNCAYTGLEKLCDAS